MTFDDLTIPVVGLPITITRTYDSRDTTSGDFGVGWRLDVQSVKIRESRLLGTGWTQVTDGAVFPTYCLQPDDPHYVAITLPDGRTETFDLTLTPGCQGLVPIEFPTPVW